MDMGCNGAVKTCRVWNMLNGRLVHVLGGHAGRINAVRISPNNRTVMTVADDYTARVYDLQSGKCRWATWWWTFLCVC